MSNMQIYHEENIKPQSNNKASCQMCGAQFLGRDSEGAKRHLRFNPTHEIRGVDL